MSIWCSLPAIGFDDYPDPDEPQPQGGQVRSYASGWSNHYPTTDNKAEREASIDLATIPAWCAGGSDDDFTSRGPWIRLGVRSHTHDFYAPSQVLGEEHTSVVLDEGAARELVAQLTEWLAQPKVQPNEVTP